MFKVYRSCVSMDWKARGQSSLKLVSRSYTMEAALRSMDRDVEETKAEDIEQDYQVDKELAEDAGMPMPDRKTVWATEERMEMVGTVEGQTGRTLCYSYDGDVSYLSWFLVDESTEQPENEYEDS